MDQESTYHSKPRRSSIFSVDHFPRDAGRSVVSCTLDPHLSLIRSKLSKAYENTYKMEPEHRVDVKKAEEIVNDILEENLSDVKYEPASMGQLAKRVSTIIKDKMKGLGYERFKLVCNVAIGQQKNQSIKIASRCLWDAKRDNHFNCTYTNQQLFAVASVYALYHE